MGIYPIIRGSATMATDSVEGYSSFAAGRSCVIGQCRVTSAGPHCAPVYGDASVGSRVALCV